VSSCDRGSTPTPRKNTVRQIVRSQSAKIFVRSAVSAGIHSSKLCVDRQVDGDIVRCIVEPNGETMDVLSDSHRRAHRGGAAALLAVLVALVAAAPSAAAEGGPPAGACRVVTVPVAGGARVEGDLCDPAGHPSPVLQLLVPGGTYARSYWDFPVGRTSAGEPLSYSRHMTAAGYSTLALDPLGVGGSSHPPSVTVTIQAQAEAIHRVVQAARTGALGATYPTVVLVGHSLGTLTGYVEATTYRDVDGIVASGTSHSPAAGAVAALFAHAVPAPLDPATRDEVPLDMGYISLPGARETFHAGGRTDPAVLRADEESRSPGPSAYLGTLAPYLAATPLLRTETLDVPVLIANGRGDAVFCRQGGYGSGTDCADAQALRAAEAPFFGPGAVLETYVLPDAGHVLNLTPSASDWFARATGWFTEHFPLDS
jgi:pimeloyl-ACP methyl ester carboxylesterase